MRRMERRGVARPESEGDGFGADSMEGI